jgi:hypothetical protein
MMQANVVPLMGESQPKSAERLARDAKLASAFFDMEDDLISVRHMARIAFEQAAETVQEIYNEHGIDKRSYDQMLFAVGHVEDMINELYRKWDSNFQGSDEGSDPAVVR